MASPKTGLNAEIRDLYRLPPEEFTAARNALSTRLRKEKRADDAAEVKSLPKPTPSAWAVNALFEHQGQKMDALLAAGKRARAAQREAVSGRGAESLREAIRLARGLADELRWEAAQILSQHGRAPSRTLVERIAANLQAVAFSPAAAEEASRGWLSRDLDPPGFEVLAGLQVAGSPVVDLASRRPVEKAKPKEEEERAPSPRKKVLPMPRHPSRDQVREKARAVEEERRREAAEQARQEKEAERQRRRIAVAEEKVEHARAEADPLRQEAERLESEAAEARRNAEKAEQAAGKARERADRAVERLTRAQEELHRVQEEGRAP
jgi:DNA repair exonuclease SbcCD ATPase subunit